MFADSAANMACSMGEPAFFSVPTTLRVDGTAGDWEGKSAAVPVIVSAKKLSIPAKVNKTISVRLDHTVASGAAGAGKAAASSSLHVHVHTWETCCYPPARGGGVEALRVLPLCDVAGAKQPLQRRLEPPER